MNDLLAALFLGIIEGITEFLPISSTGHLLIAEHWLGARSDLFNISIQAGAILAVVLIYRQRLLDLTLGLGERSKRDYACKLALAFGVTAVLGLAVKKLGFELPETLGPVAWALLIGGFVMLGAEAIDARRADLPDTDPDAIGWGTALLVGVAQVVAGVFPGTSRSAAAIFAALLFGRSSRVAATEFAFLVGIPTMFAATGYELLHTLKDGSSAGEDWSALAVAFVVSAITAFAAVKWLLRYIQTHRFTIFAWYRIVLGAALLALAATGAAGVATATTAAEAAPGAHARDAGAAAKAKPVHAEYDFTDLPVPAGASAAPANAYATLSREQVLALYEKRKFCVDGAMLRHGADNPRTQQQLLSPDDLPRDPAARQRRLDGYEKAFAHIDQAELQCHETPEQLGDGSIYELALRAADAGDKEAALCYVTGSFPVPAAMLRRPDWRARFEVNANRLLEQGIQAGDWRMALLGTLMFSQTQTPGLWKLRLPDGPLDAPDLALTRTIAPNGDWLRGYRVWKLLALGSAQDPDPEKGRSSTMITAHFAKHLTEAQRRDADAWAQQTFLRAFQGRGPETHEISCK